MSLRSHWWMCSHLREWDAGQVSTVRKGRQLMDPCFKKNDRDMKMISMSQRMRGFTAMDGWLDSAKHTKSRNIGDMEKPVQLIWKKLQLNEYGSKTLSQNLHQRTIGIFMKQATLHCKLEPFFNMNDAHLGGTVHPQIEVWLQNKCLGKRRTN